jgi:hypothetical protein
VIRVTKASGGLVLFDSDPSRSIDRLGPLATRSGMGLRKVRFWHLSDIEIARRTSSKTFLVLVSVFVPHLLAPPPGLRVKRFRYPCERYWASAFIHATVNQQVE